MHQISTNYHPLIHGLPAERKGELLIHLRGSEHHDGVMLVVLSQIPEGWNG